MNCARHAFWMAYEDKERGPKLVEIKLWVDGHLAIETFSGPMRVTDFEKTPWFIRWIICGHIGHNIYCGKICN